MTLAAGGDRRDHEDAVAQLDLPDLRIAFGREGKGQPLALGLARIDQVADELQVLLGGDDLQAPGPRGAVDGALQRIAYRIAG